VINNVGVTPLSKNLTTPVGDSEGRFTSRLPKWKPIEHRLFFEIFKNRAAKPLDSYPKVLDFIRHTAPGPASQSPPTSTAALPNRRLTRSRAGSAVFVAE